MSARHTTVDDDDASSPASLAAASASISSATPGGVWAAEAVRVSLRCSLGPSVLLVADTLMTRGHLTMDEIIRHTKMEKENVQKCLLSLIQQSIVSAELESLPQRPQSAAAAAAGQPLKRRPPRVVYKLDMSAIRKRAHFAAYLLWVKQMFGVECEYILQTLLLHGRLSSEQLLDLTCQSINEKNRLAAQEAHRLHVAQMAIIAQREAAGVKGGMPPAPAPLPPPATVAADRRRIAEVFRQLVASKYIKRAPGIGATGITPTSAAAQGAHSKDGKNEEGSTSVNTSLLQTFFNNQAKMKDKNTLAREEDAAARAAADAVANAAAAAAAGMSPPAATPSSPSAAAATDAKGKRRRRVIRDEDEEEEEESGTTATAAASGDVDAEAAKPPPAKKTKRRTKKEIEAEAAAAAAAASAAKEAKEREEREAKEKEEAEMKASLDRAAGLGTDSSVDSHSDTAILWMVNHGQFLWEFQKRSLIEFVSQHVSPAAGFMVASMVHQYPSESALQGGERPPVFDIPAITQLCARAAEAQRIANPVRSEAEVDELIHELLAHEAHFFERKVHPKGYLINFPSLFDHLKLSHIQSLCQTRWGNLAARLFRCLLTHRRLEETQVSEYVVAPRKDVRKTLYNMYAGHVLSLQEVPRSADRMPARTFFLWGVDKKKAMDTFLETLYFSWVNLRLRLESETDSAKPVLDKVDTSKIITEAEKSTIEKWKKAADRIEATIHKINQIIMLFQDF